MNCPVYPAATEQRFVSGIHNRVHRQFRNIDFENFDSVHSDNFTYQRQ
jgi:hypothetical protein